MPKKPPKQRPGVRDANKKPVQTTVRNRSKGPKRGQGHAPKPAAAPETSDENAVIELWVNQYRQAQAEEKAAKERKDSLKDRLHDYLLTLDMDKPKYTTEDGKYYVHLKINRDWKYSAELEEEMRQVRHHKETEQETGKATCTTTYTLEGRAKA